MKRVILVVLYEVGVLVSLLGLVLSRGGPLALALALLVNVLGVWVFRSLVSPGWVAHPNAWMGAVVAAPVSLVLLGWVQAFWQMVAWLVVFVAVRILIAGSAARG